MAQQMILEEAAAPPFMKNGFVLGCPRTSEAILIDPGDEVGELIDAVTRRNLHIVSILLTHAHLDHITGVGAAKAAYGAPVYLHRDDQSLYDSAPQQGAMFGIRVEQPPPVDRHYVDGATLTFGDFSVDVHHTPGHCPGGVCLAIGPTTGGPKKLFVGDTLFSGSIGRTDLPGADYDTLIRSIREVLFAFPDEAEVYSGHGPVTTIGREKRTNPFLIG